MDSDKSFEISLLWIPETSIMIPLAEFKEFERWFKFNPQLKYGWFHIN